MQIQLFSNYNTILKDSNTIEYYAFNENGDTLKMHNKNINIQDLLSEDKEISNNIAKEYIFYIAFNL